MPKPQSAQSSSDNSLENHHDDRGPIVDAELIDANSTKSMATASRGNDSNSRSSAIWLRLAAFLLAALPLSLLAVASQLSPDSRGLGTHQQLGLPPCSMRVIFGIRCPGCGMTTSWAYFTNGQWLSSLQTNAGGFLLAGFSLSFAFISLGTCWSGRYPSTLTQRILGVTVLSIAAITLVEWVVRLFGT